MNSKWSKKWKSIFIWASAYISYIAFALVGGYTIVKTDDEELKKETKKALIVVLIFAAISAFLSVFYAIMSMKDNYYSSGAYDFYNVMTSLKNIANIVTFAVFIILQFFKKDNTQSEEKIEENAKEN